MSINRNKFIKSLLANWILMLFCLASFSQTDINIEDIEASESEGRSSSPQFSYMYSVQQWTGFPDGLELNNYTSRETGVMLLLNIRDKSCLFNVEYGFGYKISRLFSNVNSWTYSYDSLSGDFHPAYFPGYFTYRKNQLALNWFEIPLSLSIKTSRNYKNALIFRAGISPAVLLQAQTKLKFDDTRIFVRARNSVRPYRVDGFCMIGWRFVYLFGSYGFTPVFKDEAASQVRNWSAGLALNLNLTK